MQADFFYVNSDADAIPLYLIENLDNLSALEKNLCNTQQFKGKCGEICVIPNQEGKISKVLLGATESNQALAMANAALKLPSGIYAAQQKLSHGAQVFWALAQYRFTNYKKQETEPKILALSDKQLPSILAEVNAIFLVRDLINTPTNDLGPEELGFALETIATANNASYRQCVGEELLSAKLHGIYTVGRAAAKAPRLLTLEWGNPNHPAITLVGKGVCFDSGGLDIKNSSAMRLMKKDMGGAAHAIGLAQWIMNQKLPVHLRVFIPAVENSIGPEAFRPGDVVSMYNGLSVEVDNTDAEGRLIIADALALACEKKSEILIDFATLTGSARMAVGTEIAAMFTNNEELAKAIYESSQAVADPVWRLPLFAGYESMLDSQIADIVNCSDTPYAGAITAALFLQRFISKSSPWIHFDIMAWNVHSKPGKPQGGEAMALRALMHYLSKRYQ